MLKNKSRSKESRVRAIENNQYVNESTDTDAGADCRLILSFVIFFLTHICRSLYTVYLYVITSTELLNRSVGLSIIS